jgi:hypothetical protein
MDGDGDATRGQESVGWAELQARGWGPNEGLVWFGLVWFGLGWFGLVWFGLVWVGLVWFGFLGGFEFALDQVGRVYNSLGYLYA